MTELKAEAIKMIQHMPNKELIKLMSYLESSGIAATFKKSQETLKNYNPETLKDSMAAYEELQKYRRPSEVEIDYKAEYQKALEEKYADIG